MCGCSIQEMLEPWEEALSIEERVYPNLVRGFYLNIELSAIKLDRIITNHGGVPIKFNIEDLNLILGTENEGLEIYTSRKELMFNHFLHVNKVRNICRCSDLSDDICHLPFHS